MLVNEILQSRSAASLLEYGQKGFPGYGRGLFAQSFYQYMVNALNRVGDQHARGWLTNWLCELFQRDNPKFKEQLFKQAVAAGKHYGSSPKFEQRHFYYLAQWVKEVEDPHVHDFVRNWLAEVAGGTNPQFKTSVWDKFCARPEVAKPALPKPAAALPAPPEPMEENKLNEGPGYGNRGHGGFGQKFFRRAHYLFVAWQLHHVDDPVVRDHMTKWFLNVFKLDNPAFKADDFMSAVMSQPSYTQRRPNAQFQQRQFYFLAHEVAEISDVHERKFVCDWLAEYIGRTNEYFNPDRWEQYCHLKADDYQRQIVQHDRAKASGASVVPEHPWEKRKRELYPDEYPEEDEAA